jgi:hypothetical protein
MLHFNNLFKLPTPIQLGMSNSDYAMPSRHFPNKPNEHNWESYYEYLQKHYPIKYFFSSTLPEFFIYGWRCCILLGREHAQISLIKERPNGRTYLPIVCPTHGMWRQTLTGHLVGNGCYHCGVDSKKYTQEEYIENARETHGDKYNYDLVKYVGFHTKINIVCMIHGMFSQQPTLHLSGSGCPKCSIQVSYIETKWLNYLNLPEEFRQVKIIIDSNYFKVDGFDPNTNTIYEFYGDYWHGNPEVFDQNKIHPLKNQTYGEIFAKTIQRENRLKEAGFNVVSIWEKDFRKLIS